ncbi:MAG TPA: hypothetical protein VIL68_07740 [Propionibacteriaceae bacterium]
MATRTVTALTHVSVWVRLTVLVVGTATSAVWFGGVVVRALTTAG